MDVFDSTGSIDSAKLIDYITTQFPGELASLISVRDELAKRQGAMSAIQNALADRDAAKAELDAAKAEAAKILDDAKARDRLSTKRKSDLDAREQEFMAQTVAAQEAAESVARDQGTLARRLDAMDADLQSREAALSAAQAQLKADRDALDARVKAFQDKVAALSV